MAAQITPLPTPPTPADSPADFNTKAFSLLGALPQMVTEENALAVELNQASQDARNANSAAQDAKGAAQTAATKAGEHKAAAQEAASESADSALASDQSKRDAQDAATAAAASAESIDQDFLLNRANHTGTQDASTVLVGGVNIKDYVDARPAGHLFQQDEWNGPRSTIPFGFIPEDGDKVYAAAYPEAVAAIRAGKQYAITETEWQANPLKRNCWSLGDGSTWIRAPDNNGVQPGSIGKLYKAGDGGSLGGTVVGDAIRNIAGTAVGFANGRFDGNLVVTGAFSSNSQPAGNIGDGSDRPTTIATRMGLQFEASRVVPTADENRTKTSYQCYIVRVSTGVSTDGTTDLEALAAEVAGAIAEIGPLKNRQKALGDGQTRQVVSLATGVTYTNTKGRTIKVGARAAVLSSAASGFLQITVDGASRYLAWGVGGSSNFTVDGEILAGETFSFSVGPSGSLPTGLTFWEIS